jgi:hypothetical protein
MLRYYQLRAKGIGHASPWHFRDTIAFSWQPWIGEVDLLAQDVLISHNNILMEAINNPYSAILTHGWRIRAILI